MTVSVREGDIETLEYNRDKGIGLTVYVGQQKGHASTSDFSSSGLHATVEAALSIARLTASDPFSGLAEPELLARTIPDLDLHHPWTPSVEEAARLALACERAALDTDPAITQSEGAQLSTHASQFILANSHGFCEGYASSRHGLSCAVIGEQNGLMQREYWYDSARHRDELASPESIGREAGKRTVARLGARKIATCEVPVIFDPSLSGGLIGHLVHAASGSALYRKTSFLVDALGKRLFPTFFQLNEYAQRPRVFGCAPFDNDGVATQDRCVVRDGTLEGYFLSCYSARKLGLQTTGNAGGAHHLEVTPNHTGGLDALIKAMGRGLVLTELLGHGINYINGDYSRGAAGFWVENGEIVHPVEEITVAGNLKDMFAGIVAVSDDALPHHSKTVGSIWVDKMKVAGH